MPNTISTENANSVHNHDVSKVSGTYIFSAFGNIDKDNFFTTVFGPDDPNLPTPGPYSSVGRIEHDGKGNFKLSAKTTYIDKIVNEEMEGTYAVCTCSGCVVTYTHLGIEGVFSRLTNDRKEGRGLSLIKGITNTILSVRE